MIGKRWEGNMRERWRERNTETVTYIRGGDLTSAWEIFRNIVKNSSYLGLRLSPPFPPPTFWQLYKPPDLDVNHIARCRVWRWCDCDPRERVGLDLIIHLQAFSCPQLISLGIFFLFDLGTIFILVWFVPSKILWYWGEMVLRWGWDCPTYNC